MGNERYIIKTVKKLAKAEAQNAAARWECTNCTFVNFSTEVSCAMCGHGWGGKLEVPSGKWMCDPVFGGCTFFNAARQFYCEVCNKSKPSLASVRF